MKKTINDPGRALERAQNRQASIRNSFYEQVDPRRALEMRDFNALNEDYRSVANLPQQGFVREVSQPRINQQAPMMREFARIVLEAGE